jgi:uncharacterized membrane protein
MIFVAIFLLFVVQLRATIEIPDNSDLPHTDTQCNAPNDNEIVAFIQQSIQESNFDVALACLRDMVDRVPTNGVVYQLLVCRVMKIVCYFF